MKKIDKIIEEESLNYVEVTGGINGYPRGIRRAVVFETQTETQEFADRLCSGMSSGRDTWLRFTSVELLRRRDGWHFWEHAGEISLPYALAKGSYDYNDDQEEHAHEIRSAEDYDRAIAGENRGLIEDAEYFADEDEEIEERELYAHDEDVLNALAEAGDKGAVIVSFCDGRQWIDEAFNAETTRWHDSDVWEYRIAVMCDEDEEEDA